MNNTYATAAADGIAAALAAMTDSMSYTDIVDHLTGYLDGMEAGPAAEGVAAALRDLVEDHEYVSPWSGRDESLDTYEGVVDYLAYYEGSVRSGKYGRGLLLGTASV